MLSVMNRTHCLLPHVLACTFGVALSSVSPAQFVWPKKEYNVAEPGVYTEDPFIVEYRQKFFAIFRGDLETFNTAYAEIEAMLAKNPKDARALVWLGNGQTVRAGLWRVQGREPEAVKLLELSRKTLDQPLSYGQKTPIFT
jgi:hypothetical protein